MYHIIGRGRRISYNAISRQSLALAVPRIYGRPTHRAHGSTAAPSQPIHRYAVVRRDLGIISIDLVENVEIEIHLARIAIEHELNECH